MFQQVRSLLIGMFCAILRPPPDHHCRVPPQGLRVRRSGRNDGAADGSKGLWKAFGHGFGGFLGRIKTFGLSLSLISQSHHLFSLFADQIAMLFSTAWASALAFAGTVLAAATPPLPSAANDSCSESLASLDLPSAWFSNTACSGNARQTCSILQYLFPSNETFTGGSQYYEPLVEVL